MELYENYCIEIAHELGQIPVFLPGTTIKVGDIISFNNNFFRPKPIGTINHVSSLTNLGITSFNTIKGTGKHPYLFASRKSVGIEFNAKAAGDDNLNGELSITFNKEGSTYFSAVDCTEIKLSDISFLKSELEPHKNIIKWNSCYIVASVTIAKKALIMQSNSDNASLVLSGDVKGLNASINPPINLNASLNFKINSIKDAAFIKSWSNNVTVFISVLQFRKKYLGGWEVDFKKALYDDSIKDEYELILINPRDL